MTTTQQVVIKMIILPPEPPQFNSSRSTDWREHVIEALADELAAAKAELAARKDENAALAAALKFYKAFLLAALQRLQVFVSALDADAGAGLARMLACELADRRELGKGIARENDEAVAA